jgi:hypothetical protein
MKSSIMNPWKRLGIRPAIGLMIGQKQIAMSVTAATPRGRRVIARELQDCDEGSVEDVLGRMFEAWVSPLGAKGPKRRPGTRLGLIESRAFQATLPITPANRQHTPQNFFLEAVQATNVRAEDRIVELLKIELNSRPLACVAASPRGVIESLIEMMSRLGTCVELIEPAPSALYRAGVYHRKAPRGSKLCARFFLGENQAIGILAAAAQPLFWHTFDVPAGEGTAAILAAYSTLWMMGRHARITVPIDTVIVHGRPDLTLTQQEDDFRQRTGARFIRCTEPNYDSAAVALGLALASPLTDDQGLDLARTLKPPVKLRDIFPYGEVVAHSVLLAVASLFLLGMTAETNHRLRSIGGALKAFPWITNQDQSKLDAEKNEVQQRLKAISVFRDSRVSWAGSLRTIAATMPESTVITTLSGDAEIEAGSRSGPAKSKKKLVVSFETPLAGNGSLPQEIDGFLASLRGDAKLRRHFPLIEVTGFRASAVKQGVRPSASYSIVCLPGADKSKNQSGR